MLTYKPTVPGIHYTRLFHQNVALHGGMRGIFLHASLWKAKELRRTRVRVLAESRSTLRRGLPPLRQNLHSIEHLWLSSQFTPDLAKDRFVKQSSSLLALHPPINACQ